MPSETEFSELTHLKDGCFEPSLTLSSDGMPLHLYRSTLGAGPALVFANALGAPAEILEPFAEYARERVSLFTWDPRGMPGPGLADFASVGPRDHARDLLALLDFFGLASASLAGWCTGAEVVLEAARLAPERIDLAILLNGDYSFDVQENGERGQVTKQLCREVEANPALLDVYYALVAPPADASRPIEGLSPQDARVFGLLSRAAKSDPEKFRRFCVMSNRFFGNGIERWIGEVSCRCVALGAERDVIAHASSTRRIAELLPHCEVEIRPGTTHFSICYDTALFERLIALVRGGAPDPDTAG